MFINPSAEAIRTLHCDLPHWFAAYKRDLPMRAADVSDWGTLILEIVSQQTPIVRVQPIWPEWVERWPTPAGVAATSSADIIIAWADLGYPSRTLRLRACTAAIVEKHGGEVPLSLRELTLLPSVGTYTVSALLAFRHGIRVPVLDMNVRRVLVRLLDGREFPPHTTPLKAETMWADAMLPEDGHKAAEVGLSLMEFGALVRSQLSPSCDECTIHGNCAWVVAGFPKDEERPTPQPYADIDRQARGRIIRALRTTHLEGTDGLTKRKVLDVTHINGSGRYQPTHAYRVLLKEGMIVYNEDAKHVALPR